LSRAVVNRRFAGLFDAETFIGVDATRHLDFDSVAVDDHGTAGIVQAPPMNHGGIRVKGEPDDLSSAARSVLQARAVLRTAGILETKASGVANCALCFVADPGAVGYDPASAGTTVTADASAANTSRTAVAACLAAPHDAQR
jgi:hypothetical protein